MQILAKFVLNYYKRGYSGSAFKRSKFNYSLRLNWRTERLENSNCSIPTHLPNYNKLPQIEEAIFKLKFHRNYNSKFTAATLYDLTMFIITLLLYRQSKEYRFSSLKVRSKTPLAINNDCAFVTISTCESKWLDNLSIQTQERNNRIFQRTKLRTAVRSLY